MNYLALNYQGVAMTKSELIERLIDQNEQLSIKDVELAVKTMLDHMTESLSRVIG